MIWCPYVTDAPAEAQWRILNTRIHPAMVPLRIQGAAMRSGAAIMAGQG